MSNIKESLHIRKNSSPKFTEIELPASKSIANRALMISAFAGKASNLINLSDARDTQTMKRLLQDSGPVWDVLDAGTTMRFLTAYAAVRKGTKVLTGSTRMKERPIRLLADALKELGATVNFKENKGYPPLEITGLTTQQTRKLTIRGDVSSQYISALLMIAPILPEGLLLSLEGRIASKPYIEMTLLVMKTFGVTGEWQDNHTIEIKPQSYKPCTYTIEPDWSAASYWYSIVSMNPEQSVLLKDLTDQSIQGDRKMAHMMLQLGVNTEFSSAGALLTDGETEKEMELDFTDCPDLAQTIAAICAWKGTTCHMSGLESLRIKETDRIAALQTELGKIGARLIEEEDAWTLVPAKVLHKGSSIEFATYHDHRMAMALAPLASGYDLTIEDPGVVNKSYPHFWKDLELAGFAIS